METRNTTIRCCCLQQLWVLLVLRAVLCLPLPPRRCQANILPPPSKEVDSPAPVCVRIRGMLPHRFLRSRLRPLMLRNPPRPMAPPTSTATAGRAGGQPRPFVTAGNARPNASPSPVPNLVINRLEIPSASVVICAPRTLLRAVRDAAGGDEHFRAELDDDSADYVVCMLQRSARSSFMADALVFPGGAMEPEDAALARVLPTPAGGDAHAGLKVCALRETFEESGVCLLGGCGGRGFAGGEAEAREWRTRVHGDAAEFGRMLPRVGGGSARVDLTRLHPLTRFVTPALESARGGKGFDARFYLSVLTENQLAASVAMSSDRTETASMLWVSPRRALQLHRQGKAFLVPPQFCILDALAREPRLAGLPALCEAESRYVDRELPWKPYPILGDDAEDMAADVSAHATSEVPTGFVPKWGMCMPGDAAHDTYRGGPATRNRIYFNGGIGRPTTHYVWVRTDDTRREGSCTLVEDDDDDDGDDDNDDDGDDDNDDDARNAIDTPRSRL